MTGLLPVDTFCRRAKLFATSAKVKRFGQSNLPVDNPLATNAGSLIIQHVHNQERHVALADAPFFGKCVG